MDNDTLQTILMKHKKYLNNEVGGERANLQGANLQYADLQGADLRYADLQGANLQSAYLRYADLQGANLRYANLQSAKNIPEYVKFHNCILSEGDIIGYKKCKDNVIVKLLIPAKAKRSNATGRKCRAEYVKVLNIYGAKEAISEYDGKTKYKVGKIVRCNNWNDDWTVECGGGIHFFITKYEAENY